MIGDHPPLRSNQTVITRRGAGANPARGRRGDLGEPAARGGPGQGRQRGCHRQPGVLPQSQGCHRGARAVTMPGLSPQSPGLSPCRGCHRGARGCQPRVPPGAAPPWPVPNSPSGRSGARFPRWKPPVLCGVGGQPRSSVCIALPPFVILTWCVKVAVLFRFYVEPKCTLFFRKETRVPSAVGFWRPKAFEVK